VHAEWLHGYFDGYVMEKQGRPEKARSLGKHKKIGFEVFEHGIIKKRVVDDNTEEHEDWTVGHPLVFPNMLKAGSAKHPVFQIRTPIDDENTLHFWYGVHLVEGVEAPADPRQIPHYTVPMPQVDPNRDIPWEQFENNSGQDVAMWVTQGLVADRSEEHLGLSDRGIILYRHMLSENVERVREGEDPINVFRAPHATIKLAVEQAKLGGRAGYQPGGRQTGNATKYSPVIASLEAQHKAPQTVS
jgi:5,5'-dehydrodivanillate O-demethylase